MRQRTSSEIAALIETVPIQSLREHPRNPRRGSIPVIKASIQENGFYGCIVAQRSTGFILAGNHRWRAAMEEGLADVPVYWVDVDDEAAIRILLADNRSNDLATYNRESLVELLSGLVGDLGGTGYNDADYRVLLDKVSLQGDSPAIEMREDETRIIRQPDVVCRVGSYRWKVSADDYRRWIDDTRIVVGHDNKSITAEIQRRLGL